MFREPERQGAPETTRHIMRNLCSTLLLVVGLAVPVTAQVDRASLNGTVTDASGSVVPGARVEIIAPATGLHREVATARTGSYNISGLPIGTYNLTVSSPGFESLGVEG